MIKYCRSQRYRIWPANSQIRQDMVLQLSSVAAGNGRHVFFGVPSMLDNLKVKVLYGPDEQKYRIFFLKTGVFTSLSHFQKVMSHQ
jgi:hypothetical protein